MNICEALGLTRENAISDLLKLAQTVIMSGDRSPPSRVGGQGWSQMDFTGGEH